MVFANKIGQPAFNKYIISLWSPFIESGPETVLHTTFITIGYLVPDCTGNCSIAYKRPFALVAFTTLPPATEAP